LKNWPNQYIQRFFELSSQNTKLGVIEFEKWVEMRKYYWEKKKLSKWPTEEEEPKREREREEEREVLRWNKGMIWAEFESQSRKSSYHFAFFLIIKEIYAHFL
jgi:hypothetical protein